MPSLHCMYTYSPPNIQIHVHDLPKFEPKTSWGHPNALTTKSHNFLLIKLVQHLLTMKQFGNPNFGIFLNFNFYSNEANKGIIL